MIPATINDVTPEFMSEVMGVKVSACQPEQIGQGVGLMGDIFRMSLTYASSNHEQPASVVVKLPSSFEENRQQGIALGMFDAEIRFYRELAPSTPAGLPRIFHAEIIDGTADFVIVMEDLSNFSLVSQADGMSADQARSAVKVLAQIHAVWWNRVQVADLEWIPSMISARIEYVDQLLIQILPVFADGFSQYLPAGGLAVYEKFAGNYLNINRVLAERSPWTLAHQDYRVENLLFKPGKAVVLDWQGIGRGPGAYDLAYLLSGSMTVDARREQESSLVTLYHQTLIESGVENFSFEQAWDDYGHAQMMGGLATAMVTAGTLDLSNERGVQLVASMAERHVQAALDHNAGERLNNIVS